MEEFRKLSLSFNLVFFFLAVCLTGFDVKIAIDATPTKDPPSPPRNPHYKIYGVDAFEIRIYWDAALNVGQLPTNYTVTYVPCDNDTFCGHVPEYEFCSTPHIPGKLRYHCKKLRQDMMLRLPVANIRDLFDITIATINSFGKSKAPSFRVDADYGGDQTPFLPTPLPPKSFQVTLAGSREIRVSWAQQTSYWVSYDCKYTILYHSKTDHNNKTKIVQNLEVITLNENDGINHYTIYYIYISVQLIANKSKSGPSEVLGPEIIKTDEGEPIQGPTIFKTTSNVYSSDANKRNVTIVWQEPKQSSWNGKPSQIKVLYTNINSQSQSVKNLSVTTHNIPNNATLIGLSSTAPYYSRIRLCNTKDCGSVGIQKTIPPVIGPRNEKGTAAKNNKILEWGIPLSVFVGMVLIMLLIIFGYRWYKRSHNKTNPSLEIEVGDGLFQNIYHNIYQVVDNPQMDDNEYQIPIDNAVRA